MKRLLILCSTLLVSACMTVCSTDYIAYSLGKIYDNHPVNEFFRMYGFPREEMATKNSGKVYVWSSVQPFFGSSAKVNEYNYPDSVYTVHDTYKGSPQYAYCELRIYTDNNDNVINFRIAVDSTGKWSSSRCSEIFTAVR